MKGYMELPDGPGLEVVPNALIHAIGQNPVTWSRLTAREAGKCSLAVCPGSREGTDFADESVSQMAIQMQDNTEVSEVRKGLVFILKLPFCLKNVCYSPLNLLRGASASLDGIRIIYFTPFFVASGKGHRLQSPVSLGSNPQLAAY